MTPDERAEKASRWRAVTRPADGRVYYVNSDTKETTWTLPAALAEAWAKERAAVVPPPALAPPPTTFATRADVVTAFGTALIAAGVRPDGSWEAARAAVAGHPAFAALRGEGDRRAAFDAWALAARTVAMAARKQAAEDEKKAAIEAAGEAVERCAGLGVSAPPRRLPASAPKDAIIAAGGEALITLLPADRETAITMWRSRARTGETADAAAARAEAAAPLATLYASHPGVRRGTPWRDTVAVLTGDAAFEAARPLVRLEAFILHQRECQRKAQSEDAAANAAKLRAERRVRDAFRALLAEAVADGRLTPRSRWRSFRLTIEGHPALAALDAAPRGARAADLFLDAVDVLDAAYDGDRSALLAAAKAGGVDAETAAGGEGAAAFDKAAAALGGAAAAAPPATRALVLAELAAGGRPPRSTRRRGGGKTKHGANASRSVTPDDAKRRRVRSVSEEPEEGQL